MKKNFLTIALFCIMTSTTPISAHADGVDARAEERLDLLTALKSAKNEKIARAAEDALWHLWTTAPDDKSQRLLDAGRDRMRNYDFAGAIEKFDELITIEPTYSEGWNQRATALFRQQKYDKSLEDIVKTLELEPRHFGALAGRAVILMRQGRMGLGQTALRDAVAIHPYLRERSMLLKIPDK